MLVRPPRGHRVGRRRVAFFSHCVVVIVDVSLKSVRCKKQMSSGYVLLSRSGMIGFRGNTLAGGVLKRGRKGCEGKV